MSRVAVLQSNYIPWKGYFDIIHDVDTFVFYDDVQFTKNDWRNRNRIKTPHGPFWLTVPVGQNIGRLISEVRIEDSRWATNHYKTLRQYYGKAPFFARYRDFLEDTYLGRPWETLSALNQHLIQTISREFLGITTVFHDSAEYRPQGQRFERLLDLLKKTGADCYISGPSARHYLIPGELTLNGIELVYKDYSGYPEHPQFFPPFDHHVTILDLLFHTGADAPWYIWGWRSGSFRP
jgi:hypothetical protein